MAEQAQRSQQYQYAANSNLVIEPERDKRVREPTGEVESLVGKFGGTKMGDRAGRDKPPKPAAPRGAAAARGGSGGARESKGGAAEDSEAKRRRTGGGRGAHDGTAALLTATVAEAGGYRPMTKESGAAYEHILTLVAGWLGDQAADVLRSAAEETIALVKSDPAAGGAGARKRDVGSLLGTSLSDEAYNDLCNQCKRINDFSLGGGPGGAGGGEGDDAARGGGGGRDGGGMDDTMGVAVVFEDDDERSDAGSAAGAVVESDDEGDEEGGEEASHGATLHAARGAEGDDGGGGGDEELPVSRIDAFWLQRELRAYFADDTVNQKLAEQTQKILVDRSIDDRALENMVVELLGFDKFKFVVLLMKNRSKIAYVTSWRQAQSDEERAKLAAEMAADAEHGGPAILDALTRTQSASSWTQDRTGEHKQRVARETRNIERMAAAGAQGEGDAEDVVALGAAGAGADAGAGGAEGGGRKKGAAAGAQHLIDLASLEFAGGGHFMSSKRVEVEGSWVTSGKGFEEVHVPAVRSKGLEAGERLVPVADLPDWARPAFVGMKSLNRIQSRLYNAALFGDTNLLLCAPTGAGKTNVAMLAMLHVVGQHRRADGSIDLGAFKIVYIAPMKALVQEIVANFSERLKEYKINVKELSGDQNLTRAQIAETQVIVTTPEKWDIITRKSGERTYTQLVRLVIIDEIHLLHDERGPVIESLVARTIRQIETTQDMVRIVGLSATLPNYRDVATFLRVPKEGLFYFDRSFRPVPLETTYVGVTEKSGVKRLAMMNEITYEKALVHAGKNQVLVFVHTRKETTRTAEAMVAMAIERGELGKFMKEDSGSAEVLKTEAENAVSADLKKLLPAGFAVHHAGMVKSDRKLVEDLFADGCVQVLVSTATLAWGVNLPAHAVIIKGTQIYSPEKGRWVELSPLDVMQMLGRAGRPQYDEFGEGTIITTHAELQFYLGLMNQQLPIESQYVRKLADNLNAEIVLGTVANVADGATWLGYTYLYVRMLASPALYGVSPEAVAADPTLLQRRMDLIHSAATLLDKHNLVKYERRSGTFQVTALGRVAAHYYVAHPSVATFNELLTPTTTEIELVRIFSLSDEFKNIVVRDEEKTELQKMIERVPIPVKEASIEEPSAKVNVLLQAYISQLKLSGFALVSDMTYVQQSAARLFRALFEVALRRGWAALARRTLDMCKMVDKRQWLSQIPIRQFGTQLPEKTRDKYMRLLEKENIAWERFYDLSPADFGDKVHTAKVGKVLHRMVHLLPKLELQAHVQPITRSILQVELTVTPDFQFDPAVHGASEAFWVIVEDVDGEHILHYELFSLKARYAENEQVISFTVPVTEPLPPMYFVRVISDRWLHAESVIPISFKHVILPKKYAPPTELLDLAPLPLSALRNPEFEALYAGPGGYVRLNPIQSQCFSALYEGDDNAVVCAPTGSGKTLCAELAILRMFATRPGGRAVVIAPLADIGATLFDAWTARFGPLGKRVVELTGETAADLKLLEVGDVVVSTPERWDVLSRRWKARPRVRDIALFIVDELHMIGGAGGPVLEIVVSRARYIAEQTGTGTRIVALSAPIANAQDISDWLGAGPRSFFNFHPQVRPVPLEIRIQGFDVSHYASRLLAMARPAYAAVAADAGGASKAPVIVFVPSRKQAQLTAVDIMTFARADGDVFRFRVPGSEAALEALAGRVREPGLADVLRVGVGFLHDGMREGDRASVQDAFVGGVLVVLVASVSVAWGLRAAARTVVVMETQRFDGRESRYADYPIADVLQLMGRACRPGLDASARCVLLCQASRKEYLKRFLYEPLPVESHVDHCLEDHLNAEIVTETIENKQDAVDYITWLLLYRRLDQNPNYYNMQGTSHKHVSDHLSEVVEATLENLVRCKCVAVDADDMSLSPLNLGMVAAYYYVKYTTIEIFASSIRDKTKLKGVLEILSNASEYDDIAVRAHEDVTLRAIASHLPNALPTDAKFTDAHTKTNILLQAHFSRRPLSGELRSDQATVLSRAIPLLQAMVDVASSSGWLKPALAAMELSQMVVQGMWVGKDSELMQLPHVTPTIVEACAGYRAEVRGGGGGGGAARLTWARARAGRGGGRDVHPGPYEHARRGPRGAAEARAARDGGHRALLQSLPEHRPLL